MKLIPTSTELQKFIHHYWIVEDSSEFFSSNRKVYGYPGIRSEIIIIIKGYLTYTYLGKTYKTNKSILASHIYSNFLFDSTHLEQFVIVQFKPRSTSALLPFTDYSGRELMANALCNFEDVFNDVAKLEASLVDRSSSAIRDLLDDYFRKIMDTTTNGFLMEMLCELPINEGISEILEKTGYSLSTLERYVRQETGLSPKAFLRLRKYKLAVEEINRGQDKDWQYYVNKYNYFDQSHLINTIKAYTNFTPTQLRNNANLIAVRPEYF